MSDELRALLAEARARGAFAHAALSVVRDGEALLSEGDTDRLFDVASVTKAVTAALALRHLPLDAGLAWLDARPTVRALLSHTSGLPAWRPFFAHAALSLGTTSAALVRDAARHSKAQAVTRELVSRTPATAPRPTYSDLNFLALGFELESRLGRPLGQIAQEDLLRPLGLNATRWGGEAADAVPTGQGRPRTGNPAVEQEVVLQAGVDPSALDRAVDDDNAAALGGMCGHAGLWSTAAETARLGDALLRSAEGSADVLAPDLARAMLAPLPGAAGRTLGLDTPTGETPSIGTLLGRGPLGAAGHLGFTGCSLWIDRDARVSIALLTNAVALARPNQEIRLLRPRLHDAVARALGLDSSAPSAQIIDKPR